MGSREVIRQKIKNQLQAMEMPPAGKIAGDFRGITGEGGSFASYVALVEEHFGYPGVIVPAGIREFDRSDFGVLDVALNPGEQLLQGPDGYGRAAGKLIIPCPFLLREDSVPGWRAMLVLWYAHIPLKTGTILGGDRLPVTSFPTLNPSPLSHLPVTGTLPVTWQAVFGKELFHPFVPVKRGFGPPWEVAGPTFRCAR